MFPERIKLLRKEKGISQKELGDALNLSKATITMWESGKREPTMISIMQAADYFNVSSDYLLGRTDLRDGYKIKTPAELADVGVVDVEKSGSGELTPDEVEAIRAMLARENNKG